MAFGFIPPQVRCECERGTTPDTSTGALNVKNAVPGFLSEVSNRLQEWHGQGASMRTVD
jgi:hypothetical protein